MNEALILHPVGARPNSRLAALLGGGLQAVIPLRGAVGASERVVAAVSGPPARLADARGDLPAGPALAEAIAVRCRGQDDVLWGEPVRFDDIGSVLAFCRARGASSAALARTDPSLLGELQIGSWYDAPWRTRAGRRALAGAARGRHLTLAAAAGPQALRAAADLAFWTGVHSACTEREWRRYTSSSYVALVYHRFAGELQPGQERVDVAPARFARHLQVLRWTGCHAIGAADVLAFHDGARDRLPARSFCVTVDDAMADCVAPLLRHADCRPQLFVCTCEAGGRAHWMAGEPVASWSEIAALAGAGVAIGSHARHHRRLTELPRDGRVRELSGSLADLRERLDHPFDVVAFPHGDHDRDLCRAAAAAGYRAAYTTRKGRNGGATDRQCLSRVSVHGHDGGLAVLWKVLTGEGLPGWWLRLRGARIAIAARGGGDASAARGGGGAIRRARALL